MDSGTKFKKKNRIENNKGIILNFTIYDYKCLKYISQSNFAVSGGVVGEFESDDTEEADKSEEVEKDGE